MSGTRSAQPQALILVHLLILNFDRRRLDVSSGASALPAETPRSAQSPIGTATAAPLDVVHETPDTTGASEDDPPMFIRTPSTGAVAMGGQVVRAGRRNRDMD